MTEDIALLKSLGATAYRFSLSWTRIIPKGGREDPVNEAGLQHYVKFVDSLLAAGIVPFVTLLHWDVPDELDKRYGGLLNRQEFPLDFERYAKVVFEALPKVKHWATFNEPWCSSILGYNLGCFAPGHTAARDTEPWMAGHNLLLAHGRAVKLYRTEFKAQQGGEIGIVLNGDHAYPWTWRPVIARLSFPSVGLRTLFTLASIRIQCASNWVTDCRNLQMKSAH